MNIHILARSFAGIAILSIIVAVVMKVNGFDPRATNFVLAVVFTVFMIYVKTMEAKVAFSISAIVSVCNMLAVPYVGWINVVIAVAIVGIALVSVAKGISSNKQYRAG